MEPVGPPGDGALAPAVLGRPRTANGPRPGAHRRFFLVAVLFGSLTVVVLVWMMTIAGRTTWVADNVAQLVSGVVATAMCAAAARRRHQRWTGWALLAASLLVAVCGNAIWTYDNVVLSKGAAWSPLAGDICAVVALPLAITGVLTFPGALGTAASRGHGVLDALLIATGMFFISWTLVLNPVYQHTAGGVAVEMFSLGFPASDLIVASLVIILATRASSHNRMSLSLVSAGLLWRAASDSSYSYLTALHRYGLGKVTDIGWVLGYFLIALGALWAYDHPVAPRSLSEQPNLRALVGPTSPSSVSSWPPPGRFASIAPWTECPRSASWP